MNLLNILLLTLIIILIILCAYKILKTCKIENFVIYGQRTQTQGQTQIDRQREIERHNEIHAEAQRQIQKEMEEHRRQMEERNKKMQKEMEEREREEREREQRERERLEREKRERERGLERERERQRDLERTEIQPIFDRERLREREERDRERDQKMRERAEREIREATERRERRERESQRPISNPGKTISKPNNPWNFTVKPVIPKPPPYKTKPGRPSWNFGNGGYKSGKNVCVCPGGKPAIGEHCPRRGTTECIQCNEGYVLRKRCVRDYRSPIRTIRPIRPIRRTGPITGHNTSSSCPQKGYTYKWGRCRPNRCFCSGGFPVRGDECTKYGDYKCEKCWGFNRLVNGKCIHPKSVMKGIKKIDDITEDITEDINE